MNSLEDGATRIKETFGEHNGLITNEWAFRHAHSSKAHDSNRWLVTSGSLFARDGKGYSGIPDTGPVDATSSDGNNSAVFRMVSRANSFSDCTVSINFTPMSWAHGGPKNDWSGFHIFLRYQSETELYVVSVMRSDGSIAIKKKTTGGPSNGGTYTPLAEGKITPLSMNHPHTAVAHITGTDVATIDLTIDGKPVLQATDSHNALKAGRIGIRADDLQFELTSIESDPLAPS